MRERMDSKAAQSLFACFRDEALPPAAAAIAAYRFETVTPVVDHIRGCSVTLKTAQIRGDSSSSYGLSCLMHILRAL
jgi:hypothetical protein